MLNENENTLTYNKEEYYQEVLVYRLDSSGEMQQDSWVDRMPLYNDFILEIQLISDVQYPILKGHLLYEDRALRYWPYQTADGLLFCHILIQKRNGFNVEVQLNHSFVVSSVDLVEKKNESAVFKVNLVSIDWLKFNNFLAYSSRGVKPYTKIAHEMLVASELNAAPNKYEIDRAGTFLTKSDGTLFDNLMYCLKDCHSNDDGIYFLVYDHIRSQYEIQSLTNMFKDQVIQLDNILTVTNRSEEGVSERSFNGLSQKREMNFTSFLEASKDIKVMDYDYENRKWGNYTRTAKKVLPPVQSKLFEKTVGKVANFVSNAYKRPTRTTLSQNYSVFNAYDSLFTFQNVVEGTVYGVLGRAPGQLVNLIINDDSEYFEKYSGLWYSLRVYHTFRGEEYLNYVQACRSDNRMFSEMNKKR